MLLAAFYKVYYVSKLSVEFVVCVCVNLCDGFMIVICQEMYDLKAQCVNEMK